MRKRQIVKMWAWSLGFFLFCTLSANAQQISSPSSQQKYTPQQIWQQLAQTNVVYLGETHDNPEDHQAQLKIIQELYRQNRQVAIAMEMFQNPYQCALNQYITGEITEAQLVEQSQYKQRWGFPWEYYAPILWFAKQNQLPVLAINTPAEVTRKVAKKGLESLTPDERQSIPPFKEIRTDNAEYRQMALDAFKQHQQAGFGKSTDFERFFLAQVLWDETMADKIAQFLKANPEYQVIVLAGQAHIIYGYGIPSRVERRMGSKVIQRSILLNPEEDSLNNKAIADYLWLTDR